MKKIILLHGMSCPLDECFGIKVKERLKNHSFEIIEPFFTTENKITYQNWTSTLNEFLKSNNYKIDKNTSFLCHSLGCLFVIKYLCRTKSNANTIIAVAGGVPSTRIPELDYLSKFIPTKEEFDYVKTHTRKIYNIISDNDHIFKQEELHNYINLTKAEEYFLPNHGHFGRKIKGKRYSRN